jgi:hypothetical protein
LIGKEDVLDGCEEERGGGRRKRERRRGERGEVIRM